MSKLVSILTPCYNGEKYIGRLLDSILTQTYPYVEMFVIDDGSTDNSAQLIKSYIPKFEERAYSLTYIYQENSGQSEAINKGLKLFKGDFLTWPDCDDFYDVENAIEIMVSRLGQSSEEVSILRCSAKKLDESSLSILKTLENKKEEEADLFDISFLDLKSFWFQPICYMAKTEKILEHIPTKTIYTNKYAGQNWQIMLPLFYKQKCLLITDCLCNILVRPKSHSRISTDSFKNISRQFNAYEDTLYHTINAISEMSESEKQYYFRKVKEKFLIYKFNNAYRFANKKALRKAYTEIKKQNPELLTSEKKSIYRISYLPMGLWLSLKTKNKR